MAEHGRGQDRRCTTCAAGTRGTANPKQELRLPILAQIKIKFWFTSMKIKQITLQNFRSFGPDPVTVELSGGLTAMVGANGAGKTAVLEGLNRLFGSTQHLRTIRRSDFHLPVGSDPDDLAPAELAIEIILDFPELEGDDETADSIGAVFNHMTVDEPDGKPFCRIRLDARLIDDGTTEGLIEQTLGWVLTSENPIPEDKLVRFLPHERRLIQVLYVPGNRDPAPEFRNTARGRAARLVQAISWDQETKTTVNSASEEIAETLGNETSVIAMNRFLQERWDQLRDDSVSSATKMQFADSGFEALVRDFGVIFQTDDGRTESDLSGLSEGQLSLFYLALVAMVFDVERYAIGSRSADGNRDSIVDREIDRQNAEHQDRTTRRDAFRIDKLQIPELTVFAIEEPENHLSPHYLARIVAMLKSLTEIGTAQVVFTSHSPSVMRRVEPDEVRHLRLNTDRATLVNKLSLPESSHEAGKYVREAVIAYPELYFGKFVVLAEGPSEEIVIPKIASALDFEIDNSFVCIVPLGGRHVNHFWNLLTNLQIPFATLLDLDIGRNTGGWARIKYICNQLMAHGNTLDELLDCEHATLPNLFDPEVFEQLQTTPLTGIADFYDWVMQLERFNVFLSGPLDFDLAMLHKYPDAYKNSDRAFGPHIPNAASGLQDQYIRRAIANSVHDDDATIDLYLNHYAEVTDLFPWYRYLFSFRSKPSTHIEALASVSKEDLASNVPRFVRMLLRRCEQSLID